MPHAASRSEDRSNRLGEKSCDLRSQLTQNPFRGRQVWDERTEPLVPCLLNIPKHWLAKKIIGSMEGDTPYRAFFPKKRCETGEVQMLFVRREDSPESVVISRPRTAPPPSFKLLNMLKNGAQILGNDLTDGVNENLGVHRLTVLVKQLPLGRGFEHLFICGSFNHDARQRLFLPGKARADRKGFLIAGVWFLLPVSFTGDFYGSVLIQQLRRRIAGLTNRSFHGLCGRRALQ